MRADPHAALPLLLPPVTFSFLGDFLPARLRCRGYRTVVPASQPVDTAVGAEETGPAAGHISCFILKA
uniref:CREB/ATF bZIP transcription factor n=2 Tax=Macaca TaxID=9539 RepID=A0A2K5VUU2_MACFA